MLIVPYRSVETTTLSSEIHKLIKAIPESNDFSDPRMLSLLPFPSLLEKPKRFTISDHDGVEHFEYMGRLKFGELRTRIKGEYFLRAYERLYVYGTSGSGKSHILAALVCQLIREGERVVYLPDCYRLLENAARAIWHALLFAFHDTAHLEAVENPDDVDALIAFMSHWKNLYVVVDQMNSLEAVQQDERAEKKKKVRDWLDRMRSGHRYIFSASANEISSREAHTKQSGIEVFYILGGMTKVC